MRCRICSSAKRVAIEAAAVASSVSDVATRFGVSESSLERHLASHPRAAIVSEPEEPAPPPPPPLRERRRAPTPAPGPPSSAPLESGEDETPPETVRSARPNASARARALAIAEMIDGFLSEARKPSDDEDAVHASYADKASLARAAIAANRQLAQLTGEAGASETAVLSSPVVQRLLADILSALAPHPEALRAVHAKIVPSSAARRSEAA